MRKVEKTYEDRESPEWREELVDGFSGMVYDYLKKEGLLKGEERLSEKASRAINKARGIAEGWDAEINACSLEDANIY